MDAKLSVRQKRFAAHYVRHGNGARAAREAGYAPRSARIAASRLLTKDNVQAAIAAERRAYERLTGTSREQVAAELMDAVDLARAQGDARGMIAALREVGRVCGYYEQHTHQCP
jgi:phage terminase small subunit